MSDLETPVEVTGEILLAPVSCKKRVCDVKASYEAYVNAGPARIEGKKSLRTVDIALAR